jgi:hypothetical protein
MEQKHWLTSLTIQGQLVTALPAIYAIAKMAGLDLPDGTLENIINGVSAVALVVGSIMTVVGRFRATTTLTTK